MTAYSHLLKGLALGALSCGLLAVLPEGAEARERSGRRSERRSESRHDSRSERYSDDWGYRAFIPDGGGGRVYYGDPDGYSNGNIYGWNNGCYDEGWNHGNRPWRIYRYGDRYDNYGNGLSISLNGDNFSLNYRRRGRPIYSAPDCAEYGYYGRGRYDSATYVYGDGPIVIDGRGRDYDYTRPPQDYSGDVYYDYSRHEDNDTTYNYYDSPVQPREQPSRYIETPAYGPQLPESDAAERPQRAVGLRFHDQTRLAAHDGDWRLSIVEGKLYAARGKGKGQLVASGVDGDFGAYAYNSGGLLSLVYRSGGDVYASSQDPEGRWLAEGLPYNVDFRAENSLGLVGGDLWFTFSATDGLRYVVVLRDGVWSELGSASGGRR
ncbi:hypothetical protein IT575_11800 [bacterium]|nr:hypothetical protein [bacterium]